MHIPLGATRNPTLPLTLTLTVISLLPFPTDAEENQGEIEIRDARIARAVHFVTIGDKVCDLTSFICVSIFSASSVSISVSVCLFARYICVSVSLFLFVSVYRLLSGIAFFLVYKNFSLC